MAMRSTDPRLPVRFAIAACAFFGPPELGKLTRYWMRPVLRRPNGPRSDYRQYA
jgi:hypothetical protein